jgi:hypothetical protein
VNLVSGVRKDKGNIIFSSEISLVSFPIKLAAFQISGGAEH